MGNGTKNKEHNRTCKCTDTRTQAMNIDSVPTTGILQPSHTSWLLSLRKRSRKEVGSEKNWLSQPTLPLLTAARGHTRSSLAEPDSHTKNGESGSARLCKIRAEQKIHVQQAKCSPRGNPTAAAAARFTMEPDVSPTTPYRMFHYHRATFSAGLDCITSYMRRNSSMEVQKAITITLIGTAMPLF